MLVDPKWPLTERFASEVRAAASAIGQQIEVLYVGSDREIETAFATLVQRGAGALLIGPGGFLLIQRERIAALAAQHKLPTVYFSTEFARAGGLASTSAVPDQYRRAAVYVDRILKGDKPADLPVQMPVRYVLTVNSQDGQDARTHRTGHVARRADEVIE